MSSKTKQSVGMPFLPMPQPWSHVADKNHYCRVRFPFGEHALLTGSFLAPSVCHPRRDAEQKAASRVAFGDGFRFCTRDHQGGQADIASANVKPGLNDFRPANLESTRLADLRQRRPQVADQAVLE